MIRTDFDLASDLKLVMVWDGTAICLRLLGLIEGRYVYLTPKSAIPQERLIAFCDRRINFSPIPLGEYEIEIHDAVFELRIPTWDNVQADRGSFAIAVRDFVTKIEIKKKYGQ